MIKNSHTVQYDNVIQELLNGSELDIEYTYATWRDYHTVIAMRFDSKEDFLIWKLSGCTIHFISHTEQKDIEYNNNLTINDHMKIHHNSLFTLSNGLISIRTHDLIGRYGVYYE